MMEGYRFERISERNLSDLVYLFKKQNKQFSFEYFLKKFNTQYTGLTYVGYFAYSESNEPAAFYGVFPCYLKYKTENILAAQSGDTITNPDHQRKGLFFELAKRTFKLCKEAGIQVVFGFPNENSQHGLFNKLGWTNCGNVYKYEFYNNNLIYGIIRKSSRLSKLINPIIIKILSKKSKPNHISSCASDSSCHLLRDQNFFQYKSVNPSFFITIDAFNFWISLDTVGFLGDFDAETTDNQAAINAIKKLCNRLLVNHLVFYSSLHTKWHDLLKSEFNCSIQSNLYFGFLVLNDKLIINPEDFKFTQGDFDTF